MTIAWVLLAATIVFGVISAIIMRGNDSGGLW